MEWFKSLLTKKLAETLDDLKDDSNYFQMKLPMNKITQEFEKKLRNMVDTGVLNADIRIATLDDIENFCSFRLDLKNIIGTDMSIETKILSLLRTLIDGIQFEYTTLSKEYCTHKLMQ